MTGWADVALSNLLGGVSEVLGTPFPSAPRGGGPFPEDGAAITDRGQLTINDRAKLQYMGIDPDTASLDQINKALEHDAPASPPPPPPPDPQAPPPTNPTSAPPGMSGSAVDAAKRLDDALAKNHSAINDADDELADAVLKATSSSEEGRKRLQSLQQEIIDQVNKLDSTLDTAPGQQQLATFLQDKTGDILDVLKNGSLDADSQAKVLDGLTARYQALHNSGQPGDDPKNPGGNPDPPGDTPTPGAPGGPGGGGSATDPGDPGGIGDDPLLPGGLPSDGILGGLGGLAPAMGALGGLPAALGSAIPGLGGGGGGLGDLGSAIGSALRDPGHDSAADASDEHANALKDPSSGNNDKSPNGGQQEGNQGNNSGSTGAQNAGAGGTAPPAAAGPGQVPAASTQVQLPDNSVRTADNPAIAQAGRAVLGGGDIDQAYSAARLQLPPVGSPVSAPVSPSRLQFGDIGQYTDHRVMALGNDTVWINGQVTPIEQLETGPNFLGWAHPTATTSPTVAAAATLPAPPPPAPAAS